MVSCLSLGRAWRTSGNMGYAGEIQGPHQRRGLLSVHMLSFRRRSQLLPSQDRRASKQWAARSTVSSSGGSPRASTDHSTVSGNQHPLLQTEQPRRFPPCPVLHTCLSCLISCSSSVSRVLLLYSWSPMLLLLPLRCSASSLKSCKCSSCFLRSSMSYSAWEEHN